MSKPFRILTPQEQAEKWKHSCVWHIYDRCDNPPKNLEDTDELRGCLNCQMNGLSWALHKENLGIATTTYHSLYKILDKMGLIKRKAEAKK